jgi:hypothetical protein
VYTPRPAAAADRCGVFIGGSDSVLVDPFSLQPPGPTQGAYLCAYPFFISSNANPVFYCSVQLCRLQQQLPTPTYILAQAILSNRHSAVRPRLDLSLLCVCVSPLTQLASVLASVMPRKSHVSRNSHSHVLHTSLGDWFRVAMIN